MTDSGGTRLIIVRHAERLDWLLSRETPERWMDVSFDKSGTYKRTNINMPESMPDRRSGYADYIYDSPLTLFGRELACIAGDSLLDTSTKVTACFVSPAYRCVQTADAILEGMQQQDIAMCIEAGLMRGRPSYPIWMSTSELSRQGFNIDATYVPLYTRDDLEVGESFEAFCHRSLRVVHHILSQKNVKGNNILIVGHGSTIESCSRLLCGGKAVSYEVYRGGPRPTYLSSIALEEDISNNRWTIEESPIPPLLHEKTFGFDHRVLLEGANPEIEPI